MSNSSTGFGFRQIGRADGAPPTFGLRQYPILSTNATSIGRGDPVILSANGYVYGATAGDSPILGIFDGCVYTDTGQVSPSQNQNGWLAPSTAVAGSSYAYVIDDPNASFWVRVSSGPLTFADVGANVNMVAGTVNTTTGRGTTMVSSTVTTASTAQFRVVSVTDAPINNDSSSTYNIVEVKGNTGGWLYSFATGTV